MTTTMLDCPVCGKKETVEVEFGGTLPKHTIEYCLEDLRGEIEQKEDELDDLERAAAELEEKIDELKAKLAEFDPPESEEVA